MTIIVQHPYLQALAWALIHFLWQGAGIALVAVALWRFAKESASVRYGIGVAALAAMLIAPAVTFAYLAQSADPARPAGAAHIGAPGGGAADAGASLTARATVVEPTLARGVERATFGAGQSGLLVYVLAAWLAGVAFFSLRLLGGWVTAQRMARRAIRPVAADIQALAKRVAGRLALDRLVTVFESSAVTVPMMVGWIKPAVLLPAAALSGLTPTQIEALLAHELAHVRRHDYLVNLLQSIVETLLFYHPAVWWISRQVRREREHCCDDLAVGVCDRLVYVTALADLASMTPAPRLALAATDGSLVGRIRRLLGGPRDDRDASPGWISLCLVLLLGIGIPATVRTAATGQLESTAIVVEGHALQSVAGSVAGGVASGVVGGVAGDVRGGVAAGVVGGVHDGVSGGVAGGIVVGGDQERRLTNEELQKAAARLEKDAKSLQRAKLAAELDARTREIQDVEAVIADAKQKGSEASLLAPLVTKLAELRRGVEELMTKLSTASAQTASEQAATELPLEQAMVEARLKLLAHEQGSLEQALGDAQRNLERTRALAEKGIVAQQEVTQAEMNLLRAEQRLTSSDPDQQKLLAEQIDKLKIKTSEQNLERAKVLNEQSMVSKQQVEEMAKQLDRLKSDKLEFAKIAEIKPKVMLLSEHATQVLEPLRRAGQDAPDRVVLDVLKAVAKEQGDGDRADMLIAIAREHALTAEMVTLYVSAANGIRAESDRARVFAQRVSLKGGR